MLLKLRRGVVLYWWWVLKQLLVIVVDDDRYKYDDDVVLVAPCNAYIQMDDALIVVIMISPQQDRRSIVGRVGSILVCANMIFMMRDVTPPRHVKIKAHENTNRVG
jgi:hypothetical protein